MNRIMNKSKRITVLVGAGAILDFDLPEGVQKPSTKHITEEVVKRHEIIAMARDVLKEKFPSEPHFEMLFHVLEMWCAYGYIWNNPDKLPKNPNVFPVFAPFVSPKQQINVECVRGAIHEFLLVVMDIINSYNKPYLQDESFNKWYRDFWKNYIGYWDIFNLNYDTTIEHSLDQCEDGFEEICGVSDFKHFVPQKLFGNANEYSTMSHLHGCIEFFDERYEQETYKTELFKYDFHDMYKYDSYDKVRDYYIGSTKSFKSNQAGEQFVGTPIITGLRKTDKLNIVPFDFYHGHLFNCIIKNNSLLLIGYSFGDVYINHVIERMELIHGDKKRIVLIDWWPINEEIEKITDENEKQGLIKEYMKFYTYEDNINHELFKFLCRMTGKTQFDEVMKSFKSYDRSGPMVSTNGCLMLFIGGFKAASEHKEIIYDFLNS